MKNQIPRAKCWELSRKEYLSGWLSKPTPGSSTDKNELVLPPRFCISEQHGKQPAKYRIIDDLSRSLVNSTLEVPDTYCPESLDVLAAMARTFAESGSTDLKAWDVDFSNAYNAIGLHTDSDNAATVCFARPRGNKPFKAKILAQPFGSSRAPENWGRVVTLIQFLAMRLLTLIVAAYVDDIFCCEPTATCTSGFWAFKALTRLLGFHTSDKKGQTPAYEVYLLGSLVTLSKTCLKTTACEERVQRLRETIINALTSDNLTPAAASKLRGKLGFYTSLLAGKLGRGTMGQLIARQYYQKAPALTQELRRNLAWRLSALGNLRPRILSLQFCKPIGAHSDAQGLGRVAAVFTRHGRTAITTHLPSWFITWVCSLPGESPIFLYELCAAILVVCCSFDWPDAANRTCVLCVDNEAAVATLVKGSSSSPVGAILANLFWTLATRGSILRWIEYVHTKSNGADQPSRRCDALPRKHCSVATTNLPATSKHCFSSWETLHREATIAQQKLKERYRIFIDSSKYGSEISRKAQKFGPA